MHISRMLITESLTGRVIEIDKSGSIVWQKTDLDTPMDSERLEKGLTGGGGGFIGGFRGAISGATAHPEKSNPENVRNNNPT